MARHPKPIGEVLSQLMARQGYARQQAAANYAEVWQKAAGPLAGHTRAGHVRGGVLEVFVANSTIVQELTFQKSDIVARLRRLTASEAVRDLRFRVGPIE